MKKEIPLIILEILEKYVDLKSEFFEIIEPGIFLLKAIDKDKSSDFYFNVQEYNTERGIKLLIERKPESDLSIKECKQWIFGNGLDASFNLWVALLEKYKTVNSFFDDPIIKAFEEEYYAEFQLIEEDAETKPFTTKQILAIDEHLEYIVNHIGKFETEHNKDQIQEIKKDIEELRDELTLKSKAWIARNLSQVWAKIAKQGPKLIKGLLSETKKQIIAACVKYVIEQGFNGIT
ncbi:MAG: hypothetical protein WC865_03805 [Bacteroidales bacterium]